MIKCKSVELTSMISHDLEKIDGQTFKLKEEYGRIVHCEPVSLGLSIKITHDHNFSDHLDIIWTHDKTRPLPAITEQHLRCFYEKTIQRYGRETIIMDAYELFGLGEGGVVLRKALRPSRFNKYKFIEKDKFIERE